MSDGWKIFNGTSWVNPCNCNIHVLDSTNTWVLLDPKNCPVKYWNGCAWVPIVCPCNCPNGYVQNPTTGVCEKVTLVAAQFTGATANIVAGDKNSNYSQSGGLLYQNITPYNWPIVGFKSGGTYVLRDNIGTGALIQPTAASINSIFKSVNTITGRLNIAGLFANPWPFWIGPAAPTDDQWVSVEYCINIPVEKEFVLGIAGDNQVRIKIDSPSYGGLVEIVSLLADTSPAGATINPFVNEPFTYWHMFPITLPAGNHRIIMEGIDQGGPKSFAAEIYNRTRDEMIPLMTLGATVTDLEPYLLFSTRNLVQLPPLTIAAQGVIGTWSCSDPTLTFSDCYGVPACINIEEAECE
jgi:hypothetical protein